MQTNRRFVNINTELETQWFGKGDGEAMLFGNRADFAIEAGLEPHLQPPSQVWGHMCVWCRGVPLGDINDLNCGMAGAYDGFARLVSDLDNLWATQLDGLDDVSIWNFFDGLLYGYHGDVELADDRTVEQCKRDWALWGRFDFLTNWDEMFDGYKAFIVCPPGGPVRILCRRLPAHMGRGVEVPRTAVVTASLAFTRWYEEQDRQLSGRTISST